MNWIKWQKGLGHKPKILKLAHFWKCSPAEAAGTCMMVWDWADTNSVDGYVDCPVDSLRSTLAGITCRSDIITGMEQVGWLEVTPHGVSFPDFTQHNGNSAKKRAQMTRNQAKWRNGANGHVDRSVDSTLSTTLSTRVEKSREE